MNKKLPKRKSPRLQGYDYAQSGAYFITICTHQRKHLFGEIIKGEDDIVLSEAGKIAYARWQALPEHHAQVKLDEFVIMPNHLHGILFLDNDNRAARSVSTVIGSYKSSVTRYIRKSLQQKTLTVWQGRFYDRIVRNETSLNYLRNYVIHNVALWAEDEFYS